MVMAFDTFREWVHKIYPTAEGLSVINARKPRTAGLSKLYVLEVDFKVAAEAAKQLDAGLQPLREKYGLDFIVLEPGMKLRRFDEI